MTNTPTQQHTQTDTHTHTRAHAGRQARNCTQRQNRIHASAGRLETAVASNDNSNRRQKQLTMAAASQDALQATYVDFSELVLREVSIIHMVSTAIITYSLLLIESRPWILWCCLQGNMAQSAGGCQGVLCQRREEGHREGGQTVVARQASQYNCTARHLVLSAGHIPNYGVCRGRHTA